MILPEKRSPARPVNGGRLAKLATEPQAPPEEDDSEVYVTGKAFLLRRSRR